MDSESRPPLPRPSRTLPAQTGARPPRPSQPVVLPGTAQEAAEELEKAQAILDVVQHSARFTRAVATAKPIESLRLRPIIFAVVAVTMLAVTLSTYLTRGEWIF